MTRFHWAATATAAVALALLPVQADASLVLQGVHKFQGFGLVNGNAVLTLQSPGNSTAESGSVGRAIGNPDDVLTGDFQPGTSQTGTRTISALGITSAADLRVVFYALEPGNTLSSILLNNLQLNIYSAGGALLFNSGAFAAISFPDTHTDGGNSGFVFALDAVAAAAAQMAAFGFGFGSNFIGLSASAANATGGKETFFVASAGSVAPSQNVAEPDTLVLAGIALIGLAALLRRKS